MEVHFIAIGGTAMHNLAIVLHKQGHRVSGSDDYIYEPSRSRLSNYGLLPEKTGWFPEKIHAGIDAVVLGMHARADNPELARARELDLKIYSFPEYLYEQTHHKKRIVVGGSHGKTTITAMVIHVLRKMGLVFDFMAGAMLEGCETMIELHEESEIAVFEGDEYQTSAMDKRP
jgi:UDP-N-acetylmuramate: L-alanyl-gamma-D-glutamyl-meso-diaminopimelate ligase